MATWVIGDLQGCFRSFLALLHAVQFDPTVDTLWFTGDLVNRGADSLAVLRWMVEHDHLVTAVLGNHDLHLLARAEGLRGMGRRDSLSEVLHAQDRDDLLAWLRRRPLMHQQDGYALVHAGLMPQWTLAEAQGYADALSVELLKDPWSTLLVRPMGDRPLTWRPRAPSLSLALTVLTTIRCLDARGRVNRRFNGPPERKPEGAVPWFKAADRRWRKEAVVLFGHWAALGHRRGKWWVSLDTGCVWGGSLTAMRLDDGEVVQVPSQEESV